MTRLPRDVIKRAAQDRIEAVLRALGIHDTPRGGYLTTINTMRGETGKNSPSLQIWVKPGFEGAWKDHGADLKGDVFDLVAYWNGWDGESDRGFSKSCDWLAATLGLGADRRPESERARDARVASESAARRAAEQAAKDEQARRLAHAIWLKGTADLSVLKPYCQNRGIDLGRLARLPGAIRVIAPDPLHRHRESGLALPVVAALMQDAERVRAVHRTWLTPDFSRKASTLPGWQSSWPVRKIWPSFTGAFIALARGQSGLPWRAANAAGIADDLVLVEGWEKGLAVAVADHGPRVWAFGSLANLAHVPVPDCAASIIVAADNDAGNVRAQELLERGLEHLATSGRPVSVVRAAIGKDVDELLKAGEER